MDILIVSPIDLVNFSSFKFPRETHERPPNSYTRRLSSEIGGSARFLRLGGSLEIGLVSEGCCAEMRGFRALQSGRKRPSPPSFLQLASGDGAAPFTSLLPFVADSSEFNIMANIIGDPRTMQTIWTCGFRLSLSARNLPPLPLLCERGTGDRQCGGRGWPRDKAANEQKIACSRRKLRASPAKYDGHR